MGDGENVLIAVVADADPRNQATNSGVAANLLSALLRRDDVVITAAVSSRPSWLLLSVVRLLSVRPSAREWRLTARRGWLARASRSGTRNYRLRHRGVFRQAGGVVVHVRNVYSPLNCRYVAFVDTTIVESSRHWAEWDRASVPLMNYERRYYRGASVVLTASSSARLSVIRDYGVPEGRVITVGGGANYRPDGSLVDARGSRSDLAPVSILFVGREFERKGGDLLVDAFNLLKSRGRNVRLVVVGGSSGRQVDGVEWRGNISDRDRLWREFEAADIFCHPARWEPYGLVVQEAMAAGLPVVVSDVGELPEIVGESSGITVPVGEVGKLADALAALCDSKEKRLAFGRNGVKRATEELSWDAVASRVVGAIRDAG